MKPLTHRTVFNPNTQPAISSSSSSSSLTQLYTDVKTKPVASTSTLKKTKSEEQKNLKVCESDCTFKDVNLHPETVVMDEVKQMRNALSECLREASAGTNSEH